ncbi:arginine N-methyltransferase 5 [Brachionus plicatilis]|uniref:Protein arginine N-methyltransferase n=1 Tax=Brachionus plicatilis TaxID=10195 RepID=A0A3M7P7C8_BRAPC|nr:arginine N-methyltransferase 5 [Brachionus plicatilis]
MSSNNKTVRCALSVSSIPDITEAINNAIDNKFTYLICPLVNPRLKREYIADNLRHQQLPLTRSDLDLTAECWQNYVVGAAHQFYDCDSEDETIRNNSICGLSEELNIVAHLNLTNYLVPLRSDKIENFSRIINNILLNKLTMFNVIIRVPLHMNNLDIEIENVISRSNDDAPWYWWKKLRTLCEENTRLGLALEMTNDLPEDENEIERWYSEPIRMIIIPTSLFLTNKSGFPVLSKAHQKFINQFLKLDIDFVIEGANRHPERGMSKYQEYLNYIFKQFQTNSVDKKTQFTKGYEDCLQNPLQPLMDNLESQVYEVFEKDPIKYSQYQKAIAQALIDRVSEEDKKTKEIVIMVVGAGRGPLVKMAIQAAQETERKVKLYAIEKNKNAINTLLNLKNTDWDDRITVIAKDMREWEPTEKADILVSELLGSVGDNELSPECLDGAQRLLKDDGISVPYRYRSFIAPVQSYKVYSEVRRCKEYEHPYEAPYVILLNNHCRIADEQFLFEFTHPNRAKKIDNNRYGKLEFKANFDATLHGFAGYFDSHLYKDVDISITPSTHSPGMFSWFPMFFPLKNPIQVKQNDLITVHFWRCVSSKQVHYEWCVSSPTNSVIHNPNGRTYWIGLH